MKSHDASADHDRRSRAAANDRQGKDAVRKSGMPTTGREVQRQPTNKARTRSGPVVPQQSRRSALFAFADNRPEAIAQANLQKLANNSAHAKRTDGLQGRTDKQASLKEQADRSKTNQTGLPDRLKARIEKMSGYAMDDVRVHYNSAKPKKLHGHAYAQGPHIYLGPGQEKNLAHEAWHVVQQKKGGVKPTLRLDDGVAINDDQGLENEAGQMGLRALKADPHVAARQLKTNNINAGVPAQRITDEEKEKLNKALSRKPPKMVKRSRKREERISAFAQQQSARNPFSRALVNFKEKMTPELFGGMKKQDRLEAKSRIAKSRKAQKQQAGYATEGEKHKKRAGISKMAGSVVSLIGNVKFPGSKVLASAGEGALHASAAHQHKKAASSFEETASNQDIPFPVRMTAEAESGVQASLADRQKLEAQKSAAKTAGGLADIILPGSSSVVSVGTKAATSKKAKRLKADEKAARADLNRAQLRANTGGRSVNPRNKEMADVIESELQEKLKERRERDEES